MNRSERQFMKDLFERLSESWDLRKEVSAIGQFFRGPVWILVPAHGGDEEGEFSKGEIASYVNEQCDFHKISRTAISGICGAIDRSKKDRKIIPFSYKSGAKGVCYPLRTEGKAFGYLILCGLKKKMSANMQCLFQSFTDTIISETRKDMELERLNETIRPRTIALSTVHTVHRLISSTLNMNELLPRIARLSLQVMKANRCSIKLVDKTKKILIPKTTIDLRRAKTKLKRVRIGKYAPGKAVKYGRAVRGRNYLAAPFIESEVLGVITLYDKIDGSSFTPNDEEIMKTLAEQSVIAIKNAQLYQEQESLTASSIRCIAMFLRTRPHITHVAEGFHEKTLFALGRKFRMNESEIKMLQYAMILHDTGQISIPEKLLLKKGVLTGREFDEIKKHPMKGADILSKFKPLKPIVPIILYHHENYDGTGYPKGLKKEEIPLAARILAVVSSFEAMLTKRPYRNALSVQAALKEIQKGRGRQFDPKVVDAFFEVMKRKKALEQLSGELKKNVQR